MGSDADYVVVGTGSAGAVLANRLSSDPAVRVVVLEAGPEDEDKFVHIPAAFAKLFRSGLDWDYLTEPQKELSGRQIYWPRGKVLGGSSSMNAMMWVRGFSADYDEWANLSGQEWDFRHAVACFDRIEKLPGGTTGTLHISRQRSPRRSTAAFLAAAQQCGYPLEEPNGPAPEGFCEAMVTQRRGQRFSTADAYLRPVHRRPNLTIITDAVARRVVFDGRRAVGVEFDAAGTRQFAAARGEVILSCGAVNTPQLLMLSGIGDEGQLAEHGIDVLMHAPEVGKNLVDHLVAPLGFDVQSDSLFAAEKPLQLANYLLRRRGMLTSNVAEAYGFVRSRPELELPDLEILFAPAPFFEEGLGDPYGHAVVLGPVLLKPHSRGTITLGSADPAVKPIIDPRYLTDADGLDHAAMMSGLRIAAKIAEAPALKSVLGKVARPLGATDTREETLEQALSTCSHTLYHPVGTCRMGRDEASVVDPQLRVRGTNGLRIADASIMPTIIRGHTHAPSVLIGEKAAEFIAAEAGRTPVIVKSDHPAGRGATSHTLPRVDPGNRASRLVSAYTAFLSTRVGRWTAINVAPKVDPWLLRATGGRLGMGLMLPSALLTTTGAKSGQPRTNAVLYFHDADDVIVIASNYGTDKHPAWYHNLTANPSVQIAKNGGGPVFSATEVTDPADQERLWSMADRIYPLYADYRRRARAINRTIPIIRLSP